MGRTGRTTTMHGLKSHPFKTIQRCVTSLINPGDSCNIIDGKYHESVAANGLRGDSHSCRHLVIRRFGDERPILCGSVSINLDKYNKDKVTGIWSGKSPRRHLRSSSRKLLDGQTKQLRVILTTFFLNRPKGSCHLRFSGIRPLRGYPPLPPLLTENQSEKKKVFFLSGKGGYPHPPLNGKSAMLFREIFS